MSSIQEDVKEEPVTFFDPSSPHYLATMYASAAGLAVFLCCGILYQALCYNKISGTNSKLTGLQYSCDCNTSLDLYPLQRLVYSRSLCEGERSLSARMDRIRWCRQGAVAMQHKTTLWQDSVFFIYF